MQKQLLRIVEVKAHGFVGRKLVALGQAIMDAQSRASHGAWKRASSGAELNTRCSCAMDHSQIVTIYAKRWRFPECLENLRPPDSKKASQFDRPPSITNSIHFQLVTVPVENRLADPLDLQQLLH